MDPKTALLLIDVQAGFDDPCWGPRNNPGAEALLGRMLERWRSSGWPIYHIRHLSRNPRSPLRPGQPGSELHPAVRPLPGEPVLHKDVNSAFIGTDLEARLRAAGIRRLVIGGLTTDHCVSTTVRMAANLGFEAILLADGTATFDRTGPDGRVWAARDLHQAELASLHGEFATVRSGEELLASADLSASPLRREGPEGPWRPARLPA